MVSGGWEGGGLRCFGLGVCASQPAGFVMSLSDLTRLFSLPCSSRDPAAAQALRGSPPRLFHCSGTLRCPTWQELPDQRCP